MHFERHTMRNELSPRMNVKSVVIKLFNHVTYGTLRYKSFGINVSARNSFFIFVLKHRASTQFWANFGKERNINKIKTIVATFQERE